MILDSWLQLGQKERTRRMQILNFASQGSRSNYFQSAFMANRYLYCIGAITAVEAQKRFAPDSCTDKARKLHSASSWKEMDILPDSCYLTKEQIEYLSASRDWNVLSSLSRNLVVDPETLRLLRDFPDPNVVIGVASNPNTPLEVVTDLIANDQSFIRPFAARNLSLKSELFETLLSDNKAKGIRGDLLSNWAIPTLEYSMAIGKAALAKKLPVDEIASAALNPFLVDVEWTVDRFVEIFESSDSSTSKIERAGEGIVNLASNPGVGNRGWAYIKKRCPWLLEEYPHLKDRPKLSW